MEEAQTERAGWLATRWAGLKRSRGGRGCGAGACTPLLALLTSLLSSGATSSPLRWTPWGLSVSRSSHRSQSPSRQAVRSPASLRAHCSLLTSCFLIRCCRLHVGQPHASTSLTALLTLAHQCYFPRYRPKAARAALLSSCQMEGRY